MMEGWMRSVESKSPIQIVFSLIFCHVLNYVY